MINKVVIHCSDSPDDRDVDAAEIHQWHLANGWDGIGYHYVIKRNGVIERGRPEFWTGSHVRGHNADSIGICLIGRDKFTSKQERSLRHLCKRMSRKYKDAEFFGHCDLDSKKTCPNFDVKSFIKTGKIK